MIDALNCTLPNGQRTEFEFYIADTPSGLQGAFRAVDPTVHYTLAIDGNADITDNTTLGIEYWSALGLTEGEDPLTGANDVNLLAMYQIPGYTLTAPDPKTNKPVQSQKDELWPVRQEAGQWLYNWQNIIDFNTLTVPVQEIYGLTIQPLQLTRYSDHLTMTVLAQNATSEPIVIGQPNEVLATFHFGSQSVDAVDTRYIIDSYRSYTNVNITVNGLYKTFPTSVDLIKSPSYPDQPWFTFNLGS